MVGVDVCTTIALFILQDLQCLFSVSVVKFKAMVATCLLLLSWKRLEGGQGRWSVSDRRCAATKSQTQEKKRKCGCEKVKRVQHRCRVAYISCRRAAVAHAAQLDLTTVPH